MKKISIGILALQGGFSKHADAVDLLGYSPVLVKSAADLAAVKALIIPGGESTVMIRLLDRYNLRNAVCEAVRSGLPVLGTCAGLILLSSDADRLDSPPLSLIDITVERNSYGSQLDSFRSDLFINSENPFVIEGVFIRAPVIASAGNNVEVLSVLNGRAVAVSAGKVMCTAFHPELTSDLRFHKYFFEKNHI